MAGYLVRATVGGGKPGSSWPGPEGGQGQGGRPRSTARAKRVSQDRGSSAVQPGVLGSTPAVLPGCAAAAKTPLGEAAVAGGWGKGGGGEERLGGEDGGGCSEGKESPGC